MSCARGFLGKLAGKQAVNIPRLRLDLSNETPLARLRAGSVHACRVQLNYRPADALRPIILFSDLYSRFDLFLLLSFGEQTAR